MICFCKSLQKVNFVVAAFMYSLPLTDPFILEVHGISFRFRWYIRNRSWCTLPGNMAGSLWRFCRRWSTSCTTSTLTETLRCFSGRPMSSSTGPLGRESWSSGPGNEVSLHETGSSVKTPGRSNTPPSLTAGQWWSEPSDYFCLSVIFITFCGCAHYILFLRVFDKNILNQSWLFYKCCFSSKYYYWDKSVQNRWLINLSLVILRIQSSFHSFFWHGKLRRG